MKTKHTPSDSHSAWQKTPLANLIRYEPSQTYFARLRVKGKLIRRSLKTQTLSVAKLRFADLENAERKKGKKLNRGPSGGNDFLSSRGAKNSWKCVSCASKNQP